MAATEEKRWAERQDIYESLEPHAERNFLRELQASDEGLVAIFVNIFLPVCPMRLHCHFAPQFQALCTFPAIPPVGMLLARLIFPRPDGKNSGDVPLPLSSSMGDHLWSAGQHVLGAC